MLLVAKFGHLTLIYLMLQGFKILDPDSDLHDVDGVTIVTPDSDLPDIAGVNFLTPDSDLPGATIVAPDSDLHDVCYCLNFDSRFIFIGLA